MDIRLIGVGARGAALALSGRFAGEQLGVADLGRPHFEILGGFVIILRQQNGATLPKRVATSGRPTAGDDLLGRDSRKRQPSLRNSAAG
jgi:hypothetical protein